MSQSLGLICLVVREYDEALAYFCGTLGFERVEDRYIPEQDKRWVVIKPPGASGGAQVLLARASTVQQQARIGDQTGGRVALFLYTDDVHGDHDRLSRRGVAFTRPPTAYPYGTAAVFRDLYGNLWDLVQLHPQPGPNC